MSANEKTAIVRAVRKLIRLHRAALRSEERREQVRTDFVQIVKVHTDDGRECTLLSRDISATGIRLVGTRRLLGQKVRVFVPAPSPASDTDGWTFVARILWTCGLGDDLFENGGVFLELLPPEDAASS